MNRHHLAPFDALVKRVENGEATYEDTVWLRQIINTHPFLSQLAGHDAVRRTKEVPNRRSGSVATLAITFTRERYTRGELVLQTFYELDAGGTEQDRNRRIHISQHTSTFIHDLWELLFDQTAAAAQCEPASLTIHLDIPEVVGATCRYVRAVAEVVGAELGAVVTGTGPNPHDWS